MAQEEKEENLDVFSKVKLGDWTLKNRVAMAPMTRGRATEKFVPTAMMIKYYSQRANDAGLIISEGTGISAQGLGWYQAPGIWTQEMVEKWKLVTDEVHKNNGIIFCQLWHLGRQGHSDVTGHPSVSSSAVAISTGQVTTVKGVKKDHEVPHALDLKEIEATVKDYGTAAENALKAGFDGVELHGANGYLIDQFTQSACNQRKDEYGGSIENRLRFMRECVNEVVSKVKDKKIVGIRLSPNGAYGDMGSEDNLEVFDAAIKWLSEQKLGYIHVMDGLGFGYHKKTKEPYTLERANKIIKSISKDTILIGNVGYTKDTANEQISKGFTDMIAFGRPYISNPDLVYRMKNNIKLADTAPHEVWWGWDQKEKGYIDWKTALEEEKDQPNDNKDTQNQGSKI